MKTYSAVPGREDLVNIRCNLCKGTSTEKYLDCGSFGYVRCRNCGLIYQNPQPLFKDLKERYSEQYFSYEQSNEENFFNLMKLGLADIHFDAITAGFSGNRNFLDIGCATGMLLAHMREKGWQPRGVDICRESALYGINHRGLDIFIGPLDAAHFPEHFFRVIHFSHLIEHVPDPLALVKEVERILAPDGIIIVTTPNAEGFQAKLLGRNWRSAIADHLFLFTKKTLTRLLNLAGFECRKIVTWGGIARGLLPQIIKGPVDRLAKKGGWGDVMLFLAARKTVKDAGVQAAAVLQ